jgi:hypothetical protein
VCHLEGRSELRTCNSAACGNECQSAGEESKRLSHAPKLPPCAPIIGSILVTLGAFALSASSFRSRHGNRSETDSVCIEHFLVHPALVERLRFDGISITTGTINDATLATRAAALGVDAITTDRPAALHRELAAMSLAA